MDFSLSKEHKLLQEMYRKFAENEVKPLAQEKHPFRRTAAEFRSVPIFTHGAWIAVL